MKIPNISRRQFVQVAGAAADTQAIRVNAFLPGQPGASLNGLENCGRSVDHGDGAEVEVLGEVAVDVGVRVRKQQREKRLKRGSAQG